MMLEHMIFKQEIFELGKLGPINIVKVRLRDGEVEKMIDKPSYWRGGKKVQFVPAKYGYIHRYLWRAEYSWYPEIAKRWKFKPGSALRGRLTANLHQQNHEEFEEYNRNDKLQISKPKRGYSKNISGQ
jgi:hypothetical protein